METKDKKSNITTATATSNTMGSSTPNTIITTNNAATISDPELPQYYDSEPSSQPPRYLAPEAHINRHKHSASTSAVPTSKSKSSNPPRPSAPNPRHAPASAASVAAVLALPSAAARAEDARKKSWSERWRAWRERRAEMGEWEGGGTRGELNVMGVGVRDWGAGRRKEGRR